MQVLANLLSLAGVCPFVGSLSDLIGRRYVAIIGASLICLGVIVSSTAHSMNIFIGRLLLYEIQTSHSLTGMVA
jgi:MFS family permease